MDKYTHPIPYISQPEEISNDDYHNSNAYSEFISSTQLKWYKTSPLYYKHCKDNGGKKIGLEARMKGSLYHDMLAAIANHGDIMRYKDNWFVFEPPMNEKTGNPYGITSAKYINEYECQKYINPGKDVTSNAEVIQCMAMVNHLISGNPHYSSIIRLWLKWGSAEQSHFINYKKHGFKFRTDLKTKKLIIDWKTSDIDDLHESTIRQQVNKFNYGISAAFYQYFDHLLTGVWRPFKWVFQQKKAPFDFVIVDAGEWAYKVEKDHKTGEQLIYPGPDALTFKNLLDQHLWCHDNNVFHGASSFIPPDFKGYREMTGNIPGYMKNNLLTFYNNDRP